MSKNPYLECIKLSETSNRELGELFGKIGTKDTKGLVYQSYDTMLYAVQKSLEIDEPVSSTMQIVRSQRDSIYKDLYNILIEAESMGYEKAVAQLREYGAEIPDTAVIDYELIESAVMAIISVMDSQIYAVEAMLKTGGDFAEIFGDDYRAGIFRVAPILNAGAIWIASMYWDKFQTVTAKWENEKQAIAVMDNRVTDCCLRVHGQHIAYKKDFTLTGVPRFADKLFWSPFHWYCRTSITLFDPAFDDGITARLIESAKLVMRLRKEGKTIENKPFHAFYP